MDNTAISELRARILKLELELDELEVVIEQMEQRVSKLEEAMTVGVELSVEHGELKWTTPY